LYRLPLRITVADLLVGRTVGRALAGVACRRSTCLCAVFLHAPGRPYRLALRHLLLCRPPLYAAARANRALVVPIRLRAAHARGRRGGCTGLSADSPGRPGVLRWRHSAPPHHASWRRRSARVADVRICNRPQDGRLVAFRFQHEGRAGVFRFSSGISPPRATRARGRMRRAATLLLSAGVLLFVGVLASRGLTAVFATLALAGWGLLLVALFHLLPLVLDAAAIRVLFSAAAAHGSLGDASLARWAGES